jgi:hypothetical protein
MIDFTNWQKDFDRRFEVVDGRVCFDSAISIKLFITELLERSATSPVQPATDPVQPPTEVGRERSRQHPSVSELVEVVAKIEPPPRQELSQADWSKRKRMFDQFRTRVLTEIHRRIDLTKMNEANKGEN